VKCNATLAACVSRYELVTSGCVAGLTLIRRTEDTRNNMRLNIGLGGDEAVLGKR
jgi:hypothetical protein